MKMNDDYTSQRVVIAPRALLLQEHQTQLRAQSISRYFHRGAFFAVVWFLSVAPPSDSQTGMLLSIGAALFGLSWFLEAFTINRKLHHIAYSLARSEEDLHPGESQEGLHARYWEDAFIKYDYRIATRWITILPRYFAILEPILWVQLAILMIIV